jgi:hypothetical protein
MATNEIHLRRGAGQSTSEFGRVAAAIDEAEGVSWDRIGGPSRADLKAVHVLERRLDHLRPSNRTDWQWLAQRLARAFENGWCTAAVKPLVALTNGVGA